MCRASGIGFGITALVAWTALAPRAQAQAMDDWQVHLANGSYVYELKLKTLRAHDLLFEREGKRIDVPLKDIDELRRIHKSFKHGTGGARATFGGLAGADDDVVQLSQFSVPEKHDIVAKVLAAIRTDSAAASSSKTRH
jgi:hypothetical protein